MKRFNRSIFGLMKICKTGYWTPANEAQQIINEKEEYSAQLSLENKALKSAVAELNLKIAEMQDNAHDRHITPISKVNRVDTKDSVGIWLLLLLTGVVIGAALTYVGMLKSIPFIQ